MWEAIAAKLLSSYVSPYFDGLADTNNINVGILKGHLELSNLICKRELAQVLGLPAEMVFGKVDRLTLHINWHLWVRRQYAIQLRIEGLQVICRPRSSAEESVAETLVRARSAKDLRVQFREKKLAEREADSNQTGWALSLANRFMMDTQLDVSDVTFVYLDDSSGLLIGAHFESLEIKSTDERWRPKDEAEASTQQLFKLLCSEDLSIFAGRHPEGPGAFRDILATLLSGSSDREKVTEDLMSLLLSQLDTSHETLRIAKGLGTANTPEKVMIGHDNCWVVPVLLPLTVSLQVNFDAVKAYYTMHVDFQTQYSGLNLSDFQFKQLVLLYRESERAKTSEQALLLRKAYLVNLTPEGISATQDEFSTLFAKRLRSELDHENEPLLSTEEDRLRALLDVVGVRNLALWQYRVRQALEKVARRQQPEQRGWFAWLPSAQNSAALTAAELDFVYDEALKEVDFVEHVSEGPKQVDLSFSLESFAVFILEEGSYTAPSSWLQASEACRGRRLSYSVPASAGISRVTTEESPPSSAAPTVASTTLDVAALTRTPSLRLPRFGKPVMGFTVTGTHSQVVFRVGRTKGLQEDWSFTAQMETLELTLLSEPLVQLQPGTANISITSDALASNETRFSVALTLPPLTCKITEDVMMTLADLIPPVPQKMASPAALFSVASSMSAFQSLDASHFFTLEDMDADTDQRVAEEAALRVDALENTLFYEDLQERAVKLLRNHESKAYIYLNVDLSGPVVDVRLRDGSATKISLGVCRLTTSPNACLDDMDFAVELSQTSVQIIPRNLPPLSVIEPISMTLNGRCSPGVSLNLRWSIKELRASLSPAAITALRGVPRIFASWSTEQTRQASDVKDPQYLAGLAGPVSQTNALSAEFSIQSLEVCLYDDALVEHVQFKMYGLKCDVAKHNDGSLQVSLHEDRWLLINPAMETVLVVSLHNTDPTFTHPRSVYRHFQSQFASHESSPEEDEFFEAQEYIEDSLGVNITHTPATRGAVQHTEVLVVFSPVEVFWDLAVVEDCVAVGHALRAALVDTAPLEIEEVVTIAEAPVVDSPELAMGLDANKPLPPLEAEELPDQCLLSLSVQFTSLCMSFWSEDTARLRMTVQDLMVRARRFTTDELLCNINVDWFSVHHHGRCIVSPRQASSKSFVHFDVKVYSTAHSYLSSAVRGSFSQIVWIYSHADTMSILTYLQDGFLDAFVVSGYQQARNIAQLTPKYILYEITVASPCFVLPRKPEVIPQWRALYPNKKLHHETATICGFGFATTKQTAQPELLQHPYMELDLGTLQCGNAIRMDEGALVPFTLLDINGLSVSIADTRLLNEVVLSMTVVARDDLYCVDLISTEWQLSLPRESVTMLLNVINENFTGANYDPSANQRTTGPLSDPELICKTPPTRYSVNMTVPSVRLLALADGQRPVGELIIDKIGILVDVQTHYLYTTYAFTLSGTSVNVEDKREAQNLYSTFLTSQGDHTADRPMKSPVTPTELQRELYANMVHVPPCFEWLPDLCKFLRHFREAPTPCGSAVQICLWGSTVGTFIKLDVVEPVVGVLMVFTLDLVDWVLSCWQQSTMRNFPKPPPCLNSVDVQIRDILPAAVPFIMDVSIFSGVFRLYTSNSNPEAPVIQLLCDFGFTLMMDVYGRLVYHRIDLENTRICRLDVVASNSGECRSAVVVPSSQVVLSESVNVKGCGHSTTISSPAQAQTQPRGEPCSLSSAPSSGLRRERFQTSNAGCDMPIKWSAQDYSTMGITAHDRQSNLVNLLRVSLVMDAFRVRLCTVDLGILLKALTTFATDTPSVSGGLTAPTIVTVDDVAELLRSQIDDLECSSTSGVPSSSVATLPAVGASSEPVGNVDPARQVGLKVLRCYRFDFKMPSVVFVVLDDAVTVNPVVRSRLEMNRFSVAWGPRTTLYNFDRVLADVEYLNSRSSEWEPCMEKVEFSFVYTRRSPDMRHLLMVKRPDGKPTNPPAKDINFRASTPILINITPSFVKLVSYFIPKLLDDLHRPPTPTKKSRTHLKPRGIHLHLATHGEFFNLHKRPLDNAPTFSPSKSSGAGRVDNFTTGPSFRAINLSGLRIHMFSITEDSDCKHLEGFVTLQPSGNVHDLDSLMTGEGRPNHLTMCVVVPPFNEVAGHLEGLEGEEYEKRRLEVERAMMAKRHSRVTFADAPPPLFANVPARSQANIVSLDRVSSALLTPPFSKMSVLSTESSSLPASVIEGYHEGASSKALRFASARGNGAVIHQVVGEVLSPHPTYKLFLITTGVRVFNRSFVPIQIMFLNTDNEPIMILDKGGRMVPIETVSEVVDVDPERSFYPRSSNTIFTDEILDRDAEGPFTGFLPSGYMYSVPQSAFIEDNYVRMTVRPARWCSSDMWFRQSKQSDVPDPEVGFFVEPYDTTSGWSSPICTYMESDSQQSVTSTVKCEFPGFDRDPAQSSCCLLANVSEKKRSPPSEAIVTDLTLYPALTLVNASPMPLELEALSTKQGVTDTKPMMTCPTTYRLPPLSSMIAFNYVPRDVQVQSGKKRNQTSVLATVEAHIRVRLPQNVVTNCVWSPVFVVKAPPADDQSASSFFLGVRNQQNFGHGEFTMSTQVHRNAKVACLSGSSMLAVTISAPKWFVDRTGKQIRPFKKVVQFPQFDNVFVLGLPVTDSEVDFRIPLTLDKKAGAADAERREPKSFSASIPIQEGFRECHTIIPPETLHSFSLHTQKIHEGDTAGQNCKVTSLIPNILVTNRVPKGTVLLRLMGDAQLPPGLVPNSSAALQWTRSQQYATVDKDGNAYFRRYPTFQFTIRGANLTWSQPISPVLLIGTPVVGLVNQETGLARAFFIEVASERGLRSLTIKDLESLQTSPGPGLAPASTAQYKSDSLTSFYPFMTEPEPDARSILLPPAPPTVDNATFIPRTVIISNYCYGLSTFVRTFTKDREAANPCGFTFRYPKSPCGESVRLDRSADSLYFCILPMTSSYVCWGDPEGQQDRGIEFRIWISETESAPRNGRIVFHRVNKSMESTDIKVESGSIYSAVTVSHEFRGDIHLICVTPKELNFQHVQRAGTRLKVVDRGVSFLRRKPVGESTMCLPLPVTRPAYLEVIRQSSYKLDLSIVQIGVSLISEKQSQEVVYVELTQLAGHVLSSEDIQTLKFKLLDFQADMQNTFTRSVLLCNAGTGVRRERLDALPTGSLPTLGAEELVLPQPKQRVDSLEQQALVLTCERKQPTSRNVYISSLTLEMDTIELDFDQQTLSSLTEWFKDVSRAKDVRRSSTYVLRAAEVLNEWTDAPLDVNFQPPADQLLFYVDRLTLSPIGVSTWCSFNLDQLPILGDVLRIGLQILVLNNNLELRAAPLEFERFVWKPEDLVVGTFPQLLETIRDNYQKEVLASVGTLLGYSSLVSIPQLPVDFLRGTFGMGLQATDTVVEGVGSMFSNLTFDSKYINQRQRERVNRGNQSLKDGVKSAGSEVSEGLMSFLDVVRKPVSGANRDGITGFFKGLGKGMVGTLVKPVDKFGQAISDVVSGLRHELQAIGSDAKKNRVTRRRPPRMLWGDLGVVRPYVLLEARIRETLGNNRYRNLVTYIPLLSWENMRSPQFLALCIYPRTIYFFDMCNGLSTDTAQQTASGAQPAKQTESIVVVAGQVHANTPFSDSNESPTALEKRANGRAKVFWRLKVSNIKTVYARSNGVLIELEEDELGRSFRHVPAEDPATIQAVMAALAKARAAAAQVSILSESGWRV